MHLPATLRHSTAAMPCPWGGRLPNDHGHHDTTTQLMHLQPGLLIAQGVRQQLTPSKLAAAVEPAWRNPKPWQV